MDLPMEMEVEEIDTASDSTDLIHVIKPEPIDDELNDTAGEESNQNSSISTSAAVKEEGTDDQIGSKTPARKSNARSASQVAAVQPCYVRLEHVDLELENSNLAASALRKSTPATKSHTKPTVLTPRQQNNASSIDIDDWTPGKAGKGRGGKGGKAGESKVGTGAKGRGRTTGGGDGVSNGRVLENGVAVKNEPMDDDEEEIEGVEKVYGVMPQRDPVPPQPDQLRLMKNVNGTYEPELRTLFMGQPDPQGPENWMNLVARRHGDEKKALYQCYFCPAYNKIPMVISNHMKAEHDELDFAVSRKKYLGIDRLTYFSCRHCEFVATDAVIAWIHFEAFHGFTGIMDSAGSTRTVKPERDVAFEEIPATNVVGERDSVYSCFDCQAIGAEASMVAQHLVREHEGNTENFNGYFVKMLQLLKPEEEPSEPLTYETLRTSEQYAGQRRECYVCIVCSYVAFGPLSAIAHYVTNHHYMKLLQVCGSPSEDGVSDECGYQFLDDESFTQHMADHHGVSGKNVRFFSSVTLVTASGSAVEPDSLKGWVECEVTMNRMEGQPAGGQGVVVAAAAGGVVIGGKGAQNGGEQLVNGDA